MERSGVSTAKEKRRERISPSQRSRGLTSGSSTRTHTKRSKLHGEAMARDSPDSTAVSVDERSGSTRCEEIARGVVWPAACRASTSEESAAAAPQNARPARWAGAIGASAGAALARCAKPSKHESVTLAVRMGMTHGNRRRSRVLRRCGGGRCAGKVAAGEQGREEANQGHTRVEARGGGRCIAARGVRPCRPADRYDDGAVEGDEQRLGEQPDERRLDAWPCPLEAEVSRGEAPLDHAHEAVKQPAEL